MLGRAKVQLTQENIKFCMPFTQPFLQREQEIVFWKSHAAFPHIHTELPQAGEDLQPEAPFVPPVHKAGKAVRYLLSKPH